MSALKQILQECIDELDANDYFCDIPILLADKEDLGFEIEKSIGILQNEGGKIGVFCITNLDAVSAENSDFGPIFSKINFSLEVYENPELNRGTGGTGKQAIEIAERIATLLHLFTPVSARGPVTIGEPAIDAAALTIAEGVELPGYKINFSVPGLIQNEREKIKTPEINNENRVITLSCETSGAAIFYTTDGTKPGPLNGNLYTEKFLAPACILKARAFLSGYLASKITTITIN